MDQGTATLMAAFVEWVNTFENISRPVRHLSDLSDGIVLFEAVADMDPVWFKLIRSAEMGDNWVHKYTNLKKLYKLITRYLEEKLRQVPNQLEAPNLNLIAKDSDPVEILKLCELAIAVAVQCDKNQFYIMRIQSLNHEHQHALMLSLEQVIEALNSSPSRDSDLEENTVGQEIAQLHMERDQLERGNHNLASEFALLQRNYEATLGEKEDLKQRIRELEKANTHASQTGKSDFLMRTEIDHLRQDLQKSEERRQEQEVLIAQQMKTITDLSRVTDDLTIKADEAIRLKDKLDEYKHAIDKLQKTENVIEKYKKKLEEGADLRRQIKAIEDQNHELLERNREIEEEYRKVLAFKSLMESYKGQILALESKNSALTAELNRVEYESKQQQQRYHQSEAERARYQEQTQLLEDRVRELEFTAGDMDATQGLGDMDSNEMDFGTQKANTTELKLKISRLERELQSLQEEQQESGGSKATVLQHLLDDSNRLKARFEGEYLAEHQAKLILQGELDRIRSGKDDGGEVALALRTALNAREKELSEARREMSETKASLDQTKKELITVQSDLHMVGGDRLNALGEWKMANSTELNRLQSEHEALVAKTKNLEETNQEQLRQLNVLLTERDGIHREGIQSRDQLLSQARERSTQQAAAQTREELEAKNFALEQQLEQMTIQLNQFGVKLERAKEFIMQQDAIIKEIKANPNVEGYSEAVGSLRSELVSRDEEIEALKRQLVEIQTQIRREQQLVTSAWHEQLRKGLRDNVLSQHQRMAPTSWLGVQRRVFSSQLGIRH